MKTLEGLDGVAYARFKDLRHGSTDIADPKWKSFLRQFPKPKHTPQIALRQFPELDGKDRYAAEEAIQQCGESFGWAELMSLLRKKKATGMSRLLKADCEQIFFLNVGNSGEHAALSSYGPDDERYVEFGRTSPLVSWSGSTFVAFKGKHVSRIGDVQGIPEAREGGL